MLKTSCKQATLEHTPIIEMKAGGYLAIVVPTVGSNLLRLCNYNEKIEILRYDSKHPIRKLTSHACTYGMPTLYLPNRLSHGILKTSDAEYQLPINEGAFQNHIHGFLHTRNYHVTQYFVHGKTAICKTQYLYDEKDLFFKYLPIKFQSDIEYKLDEDGLHYQFTLTNLSERQMPYGICNHTAFNASFVKKSGNPQIRLQLPIEKKCELNSRQLSTGRLKDLCPHDFPYKNGSKQVDKVPINNDMYQITYTPTHATTFHGAIITDLTSGKRIYYEVDETFRYFIIWNDRGTHGYFCPEPMSWMINAPNLQLPKEKTGYLELSPNESKTVTERIYTR